MRSREDRFLTPEETAELLNINYYSILEYIKRGEIPSYRIFRRAIRIRESKLWDWLVQHRTGEQSAADGWMEEERFLTVEDVSALLKMSTYKVYDFIKSGVLPAYRVSHKTYRIRESELWDWIEQQRVPVRAV